MKKKGTAFGITFIFICLILTSSVTVTHAQEYPNRGIDIVVPFAAGGGVDTFFRAIREGLSNTLKVPVNIVNRPGGGSVVGTSFVAKAAPDGYTLLGGEMPTLVLTQIITPNIPYNPATDLTAVFSCASQPMLFVVKGDSEIKTVSDLIAYSKKNPGKLIAGSPGVGSSPHFNIELLKKYADITHLPLGGGGEVVPNLLGGHIQLGNPGLSIVKPHIQAGKMRGLATCSIKRVPDFPEIPTTVEAGVPEVNLNMTMCILGPKGITAPVAGRLESAIKETLKMPEVEANLVRLGYFVEPLTANELVEMMKKDFKTLLEVAKKAGLSKFKE